MQQIKRLPMLPFAVCLSLFSTNSTFADTLSCQEKYQRYTQAQTVWQVESSEIATRLLPENKQQIAHYRDVQLIAIKRRSTAVNTLLKVFPDQIETWGGVNQWLDLTPKMDKEISKVNKEYRILSTTYKDLISRSTFNNSEDFQQTFRETVVAAPVFRQLMTQFSDTVREINSVTCKR